MRARTWKTAAGAAFALWFLWLPDALGHGEEEILLFVYLAEEPHLLRISTAIVGGVILAMGLFIAYQSRAEALEGARGEASGLRLMAPGVVVVSLGVAVLLAAAFILPERLTVAHDHPLRHPDGNSPQAESRPSSE